MRIRAFAVAMAILAGGALPLGLGQTAAEAHVHGITPLLCTPAPFAISGGNAAQGAPIVGLIPRDVGQAPLTVGDGGRNAAVCD